MGAAPATQQLKAANHRAHKTNSGVYDALTLAILILRRAW